MQAVRWGTYLGSAVLVGSVVGWLGWTYLQPPPSRAVAAQAARYAAAVPLTAHTGKTVRLQDFRGKVVVLLLGYVACPETCSRTLTNLAQAVRRLGSQAEQVQVLMLSVDPGHDTPASLAAYLGAFDTGFLGLTGTPVVLKTVANALGIAYRQAPVQTTTALPQPGRYDPSMILLDQRGYIHLFLPASTSAPDIAADLATMLRGMPS